MQALSAISILLILCTASPLALTGCGNSGDEPNVVKREGQPNYIRADAEDEQLDRAVAKARETYTDFVAALENPDPQHRGHAVKKPFASPSGPEHIWVSEVTWDGGKFTGVINNEPVDTQEVRLGDRVEVTPTELSDWMYVDGNRIVGGYTVRVLHYQQSPEEQKAFTEQTGLVVPPVDF